MTIQPPTGIVTFLFTDIEGSTPLWQEKPEAMAVANAQHDVMLRHAIESNHGFVFQVVGDSFAAAFHNAGDGLCAATMAQRALHTAAWGDAGEIRVRMGLHTGAAEKAGADANNAYSGYATIATAQRVMSVANGGQVLLSQASFDLLGNALPADIALKDMGEHRLKGLRETLRLFQLVAPDLPEAFPPLKSLTTVPNNLPLQLTSFVGRESEIADVEALLKSSRLVTLTGSGGTGKTRLSQEAGAQMLRHFPHGVWLIELAPLSDAAQIIPALAQIFGLREAPFTPLVNVVIDYLRDKTLLLLLDNCEHLVEACARIADDLLRQCAGLKMLATSREALGIAGEVTYRIPSLASAESTQLFVERARAVNAKFTLTDANAPAIAQICRRLDGIPLAIELAAARIKLLTPEQLAARLDDRFRLLVGGSRSALPRQQTLRALIDWSYDLLAADEKRLLQCASVFVDGWTLEALEFVSDDPNTLELLEQLVNKSLVLAEDQAGEMRYGMLESIRQYASEKLRDAKLDSAARDRHFAFFNALADERFVITAIGNPLPLVIKTLAETGNFRTAMEWGLENHVEANVPLAGNFCAFCWIAGTLTEGINAAGTALERARTLPPAQDAAAEIQRQTWMAKTLFLKAYVLLTAHNMAELFRDLKEAMSLSRVTGDKLILGRSLAVYCTASFFVYMPDSPEAAKEALKIFTEEVNDPFGLCMSHLNMANLPAGMIEARDRLAHYERAKAVLREMPKSIEAGLLYQQIGFMQLSFGNYEEAKMADLEGLSLFDSLHNINGKLTILSDLGQIERRVGHIAEAKAYMRESIVGWQNIGVRIKVAQDIEHFAFLALVEASPQQAAKLLGAAEALRERISAPLYADERNEYDQNVARLRSMLTESECNALWAAGRALSMDQAVQLALI